MTTITEEYREEMKKLHEKSGAAFGVASTHFAPVVSKLINELNITDVLDYGAGKGMLAKCLKLDHDVEVHHYEPAVEEWSKKPDSHQLVCCLDVLEHIEPELIDEVLDDLVRCTEFFGIFSIHTGAAVKTLSDGRNAHLIQAPSSWWLPKIQERFELLAFQANPHGFYVVVRKYGT